MLLPHFPKNIRNFFYDLGTGHNIVHPQNYFYCMCKDNLQFIEERIVSLAPNIFLTSVLTSVANRSIGEVVQSLRRPLLGPSPG